MKTYSHLPCPLLSIAAGVERSTVVSRIHSMDWEMTVDVMGGIEKKYNELPKKNKKWQGIIFYSSLADIALYCILGGVAGGPR
jgi:hypothetical protein